MHIAKSYRKIRGKKNGAKGNHRKLKMWERKVRNNFLSMFKKFSGDST